MGEGILSGLGSVGLGFRIYQVWGLATFSVKGWITLWGLRVQGLGAGVLDWWMDGVWANTLNSLNMTVVSWQQPFTLFRIEGFSLSVEVMLAGWQADMRGSMEGFGRVEIWGLSGYILEEFDLAQPFLLVLTSCDPPQGDQETPCSPHPHQQRSPYIRSQYVCSFHV